MLADLAAEQHDRLVQRDDRLLAALAKRYAEVYQEIEARIAALLKKADAARDQGGAISPSWLYEQRRLESLKRQVAAILADFNGVAAGIISREMLAGALLGEGDALALLKAGPGRVDVSFAGLPEKAIEAIVARSTYDDRPLAKVLARLPADGAEKAARRLITAVALGRSPMETARALKRDLGGNLGQYLTIARTEVIGAYREASVATYRENEDILAGWRWSAQEDELTCPYCSSRDGKLYPLDQDFETHPNCRCAPIPELKA